MKKKLLVFFVMIPFFVLSACENTLSPDSDSIDYQTLGFEKSFDETVNLYTFLDRNDGEINPFSEKNIGILIPDYKDELPFPTNHLSPSDNPFEYFDPFYRYFDTEIYTHYRRGAISQEGFYYADTQLVDGKYRLRFFADGVDPYINLNSRPYPFIDGIESNGVYSYIINETYMDRAGNREIREYLFNLFYVIYHDEALPYTVYFSESYIFLISKEESFDKSCIDIFNQTEGLYLFKE